MIRTFISILITALLLLSISIFETRCVKHTFTQFSQVLEGLFEKTEAQQVTYQDGESVRSLWEDKRETLHIWLPHSAIQEIDLQLSEMIGYLYQENYEDALAKIEVLKSATRLLPDSYTLQWKNIL